MSDNLLPCPCCGSEANLNLPEPMVLTAYYVECANPNCQLQGRMSGSKDKAVKAWNTRTPPEGYVLVPKEDYLAVMNFAIDSLTEDQAKGLVQRLQKQFPEECAKVELLTVLLPKDTDKITKV